MTFHIIHQYGRSFTCFHKTDVYWFRLLTPQGLQAITAQLLKVDISAVRGVIHLAYALALQYPWEWRGQRIGYSFLLRYPKIPTFAPEKKLLLSVCTVLSLVSALLYSTARDFLRRAICEPVLCYWITPLSRDPPATVDYGWTSICCTIRQMWLSRDATASNPQSTGQRFHTPVHISLPTDYLHDHLKVRRIAPQAQSHRTPQTSRSCALLSVQTVQYVRALLFVHGLCFKITTEHRDCSPTRD